MGCLPFNSLGGQSDISIHASAKEATQDWLAVFIDVAFQSTPPRRSRQGALHLGETR